jgi:hypothetical protein
MPTSFTGGCACGAIRYECAAQPIIALNCHCRDCQRASGSAYASIVAVPAPAFQFLKGEPKYHAVKADNGHTMRRGFCPECGSPLVAKADESPQTLIIQAASLDDSRWHQPTVDIFTASAQPWDSMNPALQKIAKEPTEAQVKELLTPRR